MLDLAGLSERIQLGKGSSRAIACQQGLSCEKGVTELTGTDRRRVCRTEETKPLTLLSAGKARAGLRPGIGGPAPEGSDARARRYSKRELRGRDKRSGAAASRRKQHGVERGGGVQTIKLTMLTYSTCKAR